MTSIGINTFVTRQTMDSNYSSVKGDDFERVKNLAEYHFPKATPGYTEGVVLVRVPAEGFYAGVVDIKPGSKLECALELRRDDETPRFNIRAAEGEKVPARQVDVILYRRDILGDDATTDCEWEIISINASCTEGEQPIHFLTLMYNMFEHAGGTAVDATAEEKLAMLAESFNFWHTKAPLATL